MRNTHTDSMIKRRYSQGNLVVIPNGDIAAPMFYWALGSKSSGSIVDGTYTHTFSGNRARAALTLLGIMIGAGSIVLLAGLLRGGEEALVNSSTRANEAAPPQ